MGTQELSEVHPALVMPTAPSFLAQVLNDSSPMPRPLSNNERDNNPIALPPRLTHRTGG